MPVISVAARQDANALDDRVRIPARLCSRFVCVGILCVIIGLTAIRRHVLRLGRVTARVARRRWGVHGVDRADIEERGLLTAGIIREGLHPVGRALPNLAGRDRHLVLCSRLCGRGRLIWLRQSSWWCGGEDWRWRSHGRSRCRCHRSSSKNVHRRRTRSRRLGGGDRGEGYRRCHHQQATQYPRQQITLSLHKRIILQGSRL